jgi:hypothetical protein
MIVSIDRRKSKYPAAAMPMQAAMPPRRSPRRPDDFIKMENLGLAKRLINKKSPYRQDSAEYQQLRQRMIRNRQELRRNLLPALRHDFSINAP